MKKLLFIIVLVFVCMFMFINFGSFETKAEFLICDENDVCFDPTEIPQIIISIDFPDHLFTDIPEPDWSDYATAYDNEGDLTPQIVITENVDMNQAGTYTVTYTVSNSNGTTTKSKQVGVYECVDY
ncbi:DUF5011 domain-containing protein [Mycoplasmatota bacterium]|nr:DUF5011 domain-containing protein [Mycoplasmatota bacterium]